MFSRTSFHGLQPGEGETACNYEQFYPIILFRLKLFASSTSGRSGTRTCVGPGHPWLFCRRAKRTAEPTNLRTGVYHRTGRGDVDAGIYIEHCVESAAPPSSCAFHDVIWLGCTSNCSAS